MLKDTLGMSERLACKAVGLVRSTYRRLPIAQTPADPNADLRAWLRRYAIKHPCHGFRRAWAALRHDEHGAVNKKKVHRLWRAQGLQVPVHSPRKRAGISSAPRVHADAPKVVWAIDFQFDSTIDGKASQDRLDDRRAHPGFVAAPGGTLHHRSPSGHRTRGDLRTHGTPMMLRMDNGPELISQALQRFCDGKVGLSYIPPGTP